LAHALLNIPAENVIGLKIRHRLTQNNKINGGKK
jgi:hypothetical protein